MDTIPKQNIHWLKITWSQTMLFTFYSYLKPKVKTHLSKPLEVFESQY